MIDKRTFEGCKKLSSIVIPNSVEAIGNYAFYYCTSLKSITISNSVNAINYGVFSGCESLLNVTIPPSIIEISDYAFFDCKSLLSISIPKSVTSISNNAFSGCSSFLEIKGIKNSTAEKYAKEKKFTFLESVILPNSNSNVYIDHVSNTMPNIIEGTTVSSILLDLERYDIYAKVTNKNGDALLNTDYVGTGSKVIDSEQKEYKIIISGDVDGSGVIDATDYLKIKSIFLNYETINGVYFTAADTNSNGEIDITDYLLIKSYFQKK